MPGPAIGLTPASRRVIIAPVSARPESLTPAQQYKEALMSGTGWTRRAHQVLAILGIVLGLTVVGAPGAAAAPPGAVRVPADPGLVGYPNALAATGDSITRAYNTGSIPFTDAPANSWATGTNTSVNSQYLRILASHPAIGGHNNNDAVTGAVMADLTGQVQNANAQGVDYITILLGANDACTPTEGQMTPVSTFAQQFQAALAAIAAGSPAAR